MKLFIKILMGVFLIIILFMICVLANDKYLSVSNFCTDEKCQQLANEKAEPYKANVKRDIVIVCVCVGVEIGLYSILKKQKYQ